MSDLVFAETEAVRVLHSGIAGYAARVQAISSGLRHEMHQIEKATQDAVDGHRRQLRQAEAGLEDALESLRHCSDNARSMYEAAVRVARQNVYEIRTRLENAQRAESHIFVALHELARAVFTAEGSVSDQSSAACSALISLEERLSSITGDHLLTGSDRDALKDITGSGYRRLNQSLSEGSITQISEIAERANAVSDALAKLDAHPGMVLRGSAGSLTDAQVGEYEPGEVRIEDRFVHASVDPDVADGYFRGNVVWAIESKSGRRVEQYSAVPSEREVMFDKFTRFEVLSKDHIDGTGQWLIYMREL